jgi:hypothetical protein
MGLKTAVMAKRKVFFPAANEMLVILEVCLGLSLT